MDKMSFPITKSTTNNVIGTFNIHSHSRTDICGSKLHDKKCEDRIHKNYIMNFISCCFEVMYLLSHIHSSPLYILS